MRTPLSIYLPSGRQINEDIQVDRGTTYWWDICYHCHRHFMHTLWIDLETYFTEHTHWLPGRQITGTDKAMVDLICIVTFNREKLVKYPIFRREADECFRVNLVVPQNKTWRKASQWYIRLPKATPDGHRRAKGICSNDPKKHNINKTGEGGKSMPNSLENAEWASPYGRANTALSV